MAVSRSEKIMHGRRERSMQMFVYSSSYYTRAQPRGRWPSYGNAKIASLAARWRSRITRNRATTLASASDSLLSVDRYHGHRDTSSARTMFGPPISRSERASLVQATFDEDNIADTSAPNVTDHLIFIVHPSTKGEVARAFLRSASLAKVTDVIPPFNHARWRVFIKVSGPLRGETGLRSVGDP